MKKITYEEWVRGVNIWTSIVTAGFLIFCLFIPAEWIAILSSKIVGGDMTVQFWWKGWQPIYRIIASVGVIICAFCIHLLLISKSNLTQRIKNVSKYEFLLFSLFCLLIILFNLYVYPSIRKEYILTRKDLIKEIYFYSYHSLLILIPLIMLILFKLNLSDIGLKSEKLGLSIFLALGIGIGGGLFMVIIHCCGGTNITPMGLIYAFRWSVIDAFAYIFFCFGYSLKLLYTKYSNLGLYFLVPLLYGLAWNYLSFLNVVIVFGIGILFSLCIHRTGSFLFPFIFNFVANFVHVVAPYRSSFFTNYVILPFSLILMIIVIFVWYREYKKIIKKEQ